MNKKKLLINSITGLISQCITIICGFILPRLMIEYFGSNTNGLISSITQFLSIISFLQLGIGAVVQSSLYKPLLKKDNNEVSRIYLSSRIFFRKIALIFIAYIIILLFTYPLFSNTDFDYIYIDSLIIILSINIFSQYFFGITNQLLLIADQKAYVYVIIDIITIIVNTCVSIILMKFGFSIQIVKLLSTLIFSLKPLFLSIYVKNNYNIDYHIEIHTDTIKQRWNGFIQHLSSNIMDNTDVIILTFFSTMSNVSIYYVYHLVVYSIRQLISSSIIGLQSYFGTIIASENKKTLITSFRKIEFIFHFLVTFVFTCTIFLIVPFVKVYTSRITDLDYVNVPFSIIITIAYLIYCYRILYYDIVKAAGHYKETQKSALFEMILNLILSIVLVNKFGLVGVAIGTLVALLYRLFYLILYLKNNILYMDILKTFRLLLCDVLVIFFSFVLIRFLNLNIFNKITVISWIVLSIKVSVLVALICILIFLVFDGNEMIKLIKLIICKFKNFKIKNNI